MNHLCVQQAMEAMHIALIIGAVLGGILGMLAGMVLADLTASRIDRATRKPAKGKP